VSKRNTVVTCPPRRIRWTFPPVATRPIASPSACFHPDQNEALTPHHADLDFGCIETNAPPPACVFSGQIRATTPHVLTQAKSGPLRCIKRASSSVISGRTQRPRRAFTQAKLGPLRRIKRTSSSVMSGPMQRPRRVFTQAKLGPLRRIKRTSSSVMSGPTQRPRRAFTQAKSGPSRRIKRTSSSVMSGPTQRPRRAFTQAKSGPLRRIKRMSSSVMSISDRRGPCALNAARAQAVTYPAELHLEDYAPLHGGGIASTALRKHTGKKKSWARRVGGKLTYITCQKQDTWVRLVKPHTLRVQMGTTKSPP
jgi:hypothetical protein